MILGLVEHDLGTLKKTSMEMLAMGRTLAEDDPEGFHPVVVGKAGPELREALGAYGVADAIEIAHPELEDYAPDAWAESLRQLMGEKSAHTVLAVGTDRGNEVLARLAARLGAPFSANCIEISPGDPYRVTRLRWGGSLYEEAELHGDTRLMSLAPNTFPTEPADTPTDVRVETFKPDLSPAEFAVRVTNRIAPESGLSLADAPVVVGGGRGVGSEEGFALLEELAGMLGGAVGGSRVATNLGWRPHADQIGQTGTRIAPTLYIACGISGAIQHWVGCAGAKAVLAINTDAEAPIFSKADYAVIGDLHEVIPALCEALKNG